MVSHPRNKKYVDKNEIAMMASEFHHEPIIGLASGDDGLDAVNVIIRESSNYLSENGALIVEVGNSQWALEYFTILCEADPVCCTPDR